jgi:hypothetical protein
MNKLQFLLMMGICAWMLPEHARAQEPWGSMSAEPNPCRIEPGQTTCTSFIRWDTQGVERAKVFVTAEGRRSEVEHEFSASASCETHRCRAPWISSDTTYTFQLVDFTHGDRGHVLAAITVTAAQGVWGSINADPNPCRVRRDEQNCTTTLSWETHGVDRAKVFVTAEGRHQETEHVFSESANCEPGKCRAPWITPGTRYIFTLVDFTRGNRGRVLGSILVRGDDRY